jgi:hypothetical protein
VFGGWLNLNEVSEYLLAAPGSHFTDRNRGRGFGAIRDEAEKRRLERELQRIEVPPGHLLLFYENMAHKVASAAPPANTTQLRLFTGFRLTNNPEPIYPSLERKMRSMAVIPLKSGQQPPLYARLSWVNSTEAMEQWTKETLIEALHDQRRMGENARKNAGRLFTIPKGGELSEPIPSMRDEVTLEPRDWLQERYPEIALVDLAFSPYSDEELALYRPAPLHGNIDFRLPAQGMRCSSCAGPSKQLCEQCNRYYCSERCAISHHQTATLRRHAPY